MKIIATDGEQVVTSSLRALPQKLTIFANLDKVEYKIVGGEQITEKEIQKLFDQNKINCILV